MRLYGHRRHIRRHPDSALDQGAADVTVFGGRGLRDSGKRRGLVEPGGTLVFAVCSLEREEGEEQIAAFLSTHPEFARAPITADDVFGHSEMDHARWRSCAPCPVT